MSLARTRAVTATAGLAACAAVASPSVAVADTAKSFGTAACGGTVALTQPSIFQPTFYGSVSNVKCPGVHTTEVWIERNFVGSNFTPKYASAAWTNTQTARLVAPGNLQGWNNSYYACASIKTGTSITQTGCTDMLNK